VREGARKCLDEAGPLHVLLNNAGVVNTVRRETVDGFEETLAVNHFAPFLLTGLLLPRLLETRGARVVNTASGAHAFVRDMGFDDLHATRSYRTFRQYGRSKLANILFTLELARRLEGRDITVNCLHPGAVSTSLGIQNDGVVAKLLPRLLRPFFRTPEQGAQTSIYLCCSDEVRDVSGQYFINSRPARPRPWALDSEAALRLWNLSEDSVSFRYPAQDSR
jgi:NAD(P)-dependent dehydrogenase (short-subunit alcohol dehydrogenase family)